MLFYLSSIPVKQVGGSFHPALSELLKDGFEFINAFYLEFKSKRLAQPALLNMMMLNYDNFLDTNDDAKITLLTKDIAKEVVSRDCYKSIMSEMVQMLAVELIFI